ncbi:MAG: hypothetical protein R3A45_07130 [Bdellovibrionota bacterium]
MKKSILIMVSFFFLSCNAALDGFNAPLNSTISFAPLSTTWVACLGSEGLTKVAARIETPNSVTGESETTQKIFGQIFAQGPLRLYVKSENAEILEPVSSQITRIDSDSLTFTTNRRGLYEFVVGAPGVASGDSYSDCATVYIGVTTAEFCVNVSCP